MYCWKVGKSSCIELFPITVFLSNHFWSQISICSAKIRNIPLKPAGATISVYLWKPQNVHGPKSTINLNYVLFINILFDNIHSWNHLQLVFFWTMCTFSVVIVFSYHFRLLLFILFRKQLKYLILSKCRQSVRFRCVRTKFIVNPF